MERTVYEVFPSESHWTLRRRGSERKQTFDTRDEAVSRGRILCKRNRPSRLRIRRTETDKQD
jgi:hypothetical protein